MKPRNKDSGEVFIGFILVAFIIITLIYIIIDLSRYTFFKSNLQSASSEVAVYAKQLDDLLISPYDPTNIKWSKYLIARQSLSRVYETSPLFKNNQEQVRNLIVIQYGSQSGPQTVSSTPEKIAYLPPGTSAELRLADGTSRWVHHSVCCDPTVPDCPAAMQRTNALGCKDKNFAELISLYPTEFVAAADFHGSYLLPKNVITRTSGFPRVQVTSVVLTTTTTTTTSTLCTKTPPIVTTSCQFNVDEQKYFIHSVTNDGCATSSASEPIENMTRCDPARGMVSYVPNRDDCPEQLVSTLPKIDQLYNCEIDSTGKILTKTTKTITPATCNVAIATSNEVRPPALCIESNNTLQHETHERNLLTCSWDRVFTLVQTKPPSFCGINTTTEKYETRTYVPDFATCTYQPQTGDVATQETQCSIDQESGDGVETHYTFSNDICGFVPEPAIIKPRPASTCSETAPGVATFSTATNLKLKEHSCVWDISTRPITAPVQSCVERANLDGETEALKTQFILEANVEMNPAVCRYAESKTSVLKPADQSCALEEDRYVRKSAVFDQNSCSYSLESVECSPIDCEVSEWSSPPAGCGQQYTATRTIIKNPQYGGKECPNLTKDNRTEDCPPEACQQQPDKVTCSINPTTKDGIETHQTFSMELCKYEESTITKPKPPVSCQETVIGLTAVKTSPTQFVAKSGQCEWEVQRTTVTSQHKVACTLDPLTGQGVQSGSALDTNTCTWKNSNILRNRPPPTCSETSAGKTAVFKQYTNFILSGGGCKWDLSSTQVNSGVVPGCTESNNRATLATARLISNMQGAIPICKYELSSTSQAKPAGFCAERGTAQLPKAELVSYILNKTTCGYSERIDKSTTKPIQQCQYQAQTRSAVKTEYQFNQAKCAYDPVKTSNPQPADSCTEETRADSKRYAISRIYGNSLSASCNFKPSERATLTPATSECSARNGQRYSRTTLNSTPRTCNYTVINGSCCYYTLTARAGLIGETGLKGAAGCLSSVVSRAASQCNGKAEYTDDCIASKVSGNWSAESGCTQAGGSVNCGSAQYVYYMSPISLRWSPDNTKELSFSRFNLSGAPQNKVVVWKASSALPLLVYDPVHSGNITSAQQLFGNVFRGGHDGKEPWVDGFEALGSLDANNDDKISGQELAPLGLWFDENRDGISQPGEVKPLNHHDVTVTALFYKGGMQREESKDIELAIGFERSVGGLINQGASVDWYTEEADSQFELINSLMIGSYFKRNENLATQDISVQLQTPIAKPTAKEPKIYRWDSDDSFFIDGAARKPQGYFTIVEYSDGTIHGHIIGESFMKDGEQTLSNISTLKIFGKIENQPDGRRKLTFEAEKNEQERRDVRSTAAVSDDGSILEGETEENLTYEGKDRSITYSWKAHKE